MACTKVVQKHAGGFGTDFRQGRYLELDLGIGQMGQYFPEGV
jgi:hypothetical protein